MVKVQIISKESIKPSSSSTPPHPESIPLSLLDHTAPPIYTHLLLFYSTNPPELPTRLKASLSETLTHFYPLAGRIIVASEDDGGSGSTLHVDCTDDGVEFVEARAESDLDSLLHNSPIHQFPDLLPIKSSKFSYGDPLLALQLTAFEGGGFALGVSICHLIADGASMATLLNRWAGAARGLPVGPLPPPRFDSASVFPPRPRVVRKPEPKPSENRGKEVEKAEEVMIKRFVVGPRAMERLRGGGATRVEGVSALVWRCVVRARGGRPMATSQVVDLRRKLSPATSEESFGNLWVSVAAGWEDGGRQGSLEASTRSAVRRVDGEQARRVMEGKASGREDDGVGLMFSSWCRMPLYRNDFGCGEPVWVACGLRDMRGVCILIDTKDGDGIEVWLWLAREEMEAIESDPEFLGFVGVSSMD